MKKTDRTEKVRKWIRTGAVGVVFLAAVLCFGVQSRREKQTVVLEQLDESEDAAEKRPEPSKSMQGEQTDLSGEPERLGERIKESGGGPLNGEDSSLESSAGQQPWGGTGKKEILYVYVCGAVSAPGVYELEPGSRMYEAVEMAGGMTSEAAQEYINLAQKIEDGEQVWIPSRGEVKTYQEAGREVPAIPGAGTGSRSAGGAASQKAGTDAADSKINLNTASKEELMTLSGIGEARAEAILSYREQKGSFRTIEDIMKVPGIKDAAFQKIKDKIAV